MGIDASTAITVGAAADIVIAATNAAEAAFFRFMRKISFFWAMYYRKNMYK